MNKMRQRFLELSVKMSFTAQIDALHDPLFDRDALTEEIRAFKADLTATIRLDPQNAELLTLLATIKMMETSFSDPAAQNVLRDVPAGPFEPNPPIFDAIEAQDLDAIRAELKTWDLTTQIGKFRKSALYHAMSCPYPEPPSLEVISLLLDAGADPNVGLGDTNVLHRLGFGYWADVSPIDLSAIVKRCVALGADLEQRCDTLEWTPLILAVSEWNEIAVEALLLAGADPRARAGVTGLGCFSGADCLTIAIGHAETEAVLKTYLNRH